MEVGEKKNLLFTIYVYIYRTVNGVGLTCIRTSLYPFLADKVKIYTRGFVPYLY